MSRASASSSEWAALSHPNPRGVLAEPACIVERARCRQRPFQAYHPVRRVQTLLPAKDNGFLWCRRPARIDQCGEFPVDVDRASQDVPSAATADTQVRSGIRMVGLEVEIVTGAAIEGTDGLLHICPGWLGDLMIGLAGAMPLTHGQQIDGHGHIAPSSSRLPKACAHGGSPATTLL